MPSLMRSDMTRV